MLFRSIRNLLRGGMRLIFFIIPYLKYPVNMNHPLFYNKMKSKIYCRFIMNPISVRATPIYRRQRRRKKI